MKKVGIVTYYYYNNYGTVLQAFALQHLFDSNGAKAEVVDYRFVDRKLTAWQVLCMRVRRAFHYVTHLQKVYKKSKYGAVMFEKAPAFKQFIEEHIHTSPNRYLHRDEVIANPPKYDLYVTGSDQTWSPKLGLNPVLFLKFVKPGEAEKGSYAPSLGVASLSDSDKSYMKEALASYDYLSCRESLGAEMLREVTGRDVKVVLDPTLLVDGDTWRTFAKKPAQLAQGPYILCYFLGDKEYYRNYAEQLAKQTGYQLVFIPMNWRDFDKENLISEAGPAEFIYLIDHAEIVLTDSFHGSAFCVNLNKTFYNFVKCDGNLSGGDNSRIYDLLNRMKLTDRLREKYTAGEKIEFTEIDYTVPNECLKKERVASLEYLKQMI